MSATQVAECDQPFWRLFPHRGSVALRTRVEVQIEAKFRERFEGDREQETVFFHSRVVAYHSAERGNPTCQVPVNRIPLFLESVGHAFILLLNRHAPVVVDAQVTAEKKKAAILKERIPIQITVPKVHLQVRQRL